MHITSPDMLAQAMQSQRKTKNLSQQATAASIGVKQATLSAFENHPDGTRLETLFKLLAALDLELHLQQRDSGATAQWDQEW
ncbi:transcriptional regulator [Chimaeribacter coloradensis]|uniref:Transcriptional regulator n=1 Tax=Chimaeribacter coloradensis TaxID=2060068 RepID=A0A2N5E5S1_9GAMM|nr:helix-turn-helix domain-containing protein [Chimaeribacter coloradensis]PLR36503.1 transcriptional regulator [Chimaeribacter coloradensis]